MCHDRVRTLRDLDEYVLLEKILHPERYKTEDSEEKEQTNEEQINS